MYNILEYVSSTTDLQTYINLGIRQLLQRKEIEWIYRNCNEDVKELFHTKYRSNSYLVTVLKNLIENREIEQYHYYIFMSDSTYDPSVFTYDELVMLHKGPDVGVHENAMKYYIKKGYHDLIYSRYVTYDIDIIKYLDSIGKTVDYEYIVDNAYGMDLDPYIIRRCLELDIDVRFYSTESNTRALIDCCNMYEIWDLLITHDDGVIDPKFMDILYENHIPFYPDISYYIGTHQEWVMDHIHYFSDESVLTTYLKTSKISLEIIESIDYSSVKFLSPIGLDENVWKNLKSLKYELHEDNYYRVLTNNMLLPESLMLYISQLTNVDYSPVHELNIINAIIYLHYLPNMEINIGRIASNDDILRTVKLYGDGYRTLCKKYGTDNTVKYTVELVNRNVKIPTMSGFEDLIFLF